MNLKSILGFAVGPIGAAAVGLITVPLIAWMFSPEDVGRMNLLQVTLSLTILLTTLGLDQAYVREYHGCNNLPALLAACFVPGFIVLIVCFMVVAPYGNSLTSQLYGVSDPLIFTLIFFCAFVNYVSRYLSLILRMQERGLAYSMSQLIPKVMQIVLLGLALWFGLARDFKLLLWITVISTLLVALVYVWNTQEQWVPALKARIIKEQLWSLLRFGLPLVFSGLAYWGLTATSSVVLRAYSNLGELGIYTVTSNFASVALIFQSIFTVVWAPTVYRWASEGVDMKRVDDIARQALFAVCMLFVLVGCLSWLTDYILPEHYISVKYLVVCAVAPSLLYTLSEITAVGIGLTRRTKLTVWITLTALLINISLSILLVPNYGAAGAVMANTVAYLVFFIARTETAARVWRQFPRKKLYFHVVFLVVISIANVLFGSLDVFKNIMAWIAVLLLIIVSLKKEAAELILRLKGL